MHALWVWGVAGNGMVCVRTVGYWIREELRCGLVGFGGDWNVDGWIQSRYACIHASASTACMQTLWVWGVRWLLEAVLAVLVGIGCGLNTQAVGARVDRVGRRSFR